MARSRRHRVDPTRVVRIVGDGMVASHLAFGGAFIPVLVLDCSAFPDISDAIRVAEYEPDGDAICQWATSRGNAGLLVKLVRPAPTEFIIGFDLPSQGILVELALRGGVVQIKSGTSGSSFKSTFTQNGLYIDVPGNEDFSPWPNVFKTALMEQARRSGARTVAARQSAEKTFEHIASLAGSRMRGAPNETSQDV